MLDEEKKSIEMLRNYDNEDNLHKIHQSINVVLNLIEKQSKEIEELKNGNIDFWIGDKEIEERIKNKFVSKDKIKAKIEELEKDLKEYENGQEWEIQDEIRGQIDVLQSLLEKE